MGAKPKNVGGGAATVVAEDWNKFLRQGLNNGVYGSGVGQTTGMSGAINNALSGNSMNATPNYSNYANILGQMGSFNPAQLANVQGPQLGQNTQNIQQFTGVNPLAGGNFGDLRGMLGSGPNLMGANPLSGFGSQAPQVGAGGGGQINQIASQLANNSQGLSADRVNMNTLGQMQGGTQNAQGFQFSPFQSGGADLNGQTATAIKDIAQRQLQESLNDVRSRYSAGGGQMFGTSAQYAEGQVLGQVLPQLMAQLGQLNQTEAQLQQQNNALNLQGMGAANQSQQNAVGLNNAALQNNIGNYLNATGINQQGTIAGGQLSNQASGTALDALLGLRGQDLSASGQNAANSLNARGLDINQLGQLLGFAGNTYGQQLGAAGQLGQLGLQQADMLNQLGLNQRGQDIQSFLGQAGMNNDILQMMMQAGFGNNDQMLQQQQLAQQMLGMQGNLALSGDQMMNDFQRMMALNNSQNQMNVLQMLMGGMQQSNQLGTAQRQTVMRPSAFGQAMGAIGSVAGMVPGLGQLGGMIGGGLGSLGGMFGGGGNGVANIGMPSPIGTGMWNNAGYGSWQ